MKTQLKKAGVVLLFVMSLAGFAQNSMGDIRGIVTDEENDPAIGALVKVLQAGVIVKQDVTDIDGKYVIKPLQPGTYDVLISYTRYKTSHYTKVNVQAEESSYLDAVLEINTLEEVVITAPKEWTKSIVDKSYITMHHIDYDQISKMAVTKGDVKGMISNISSDIFVSESGQIYSRGSRVGASKTFVDGELLPFDSEVSGMAIQNLSVITGGIPAQFGDLTGAAIIITTRDYFSGIAEKNIRNRTYVDRIQKEKKAKELEEQKKKREAEIEEEKKQNTNNN